MRELTSARLDWERLAGLSAVRAAADAIGRRWGLWVGLATRGGVAIPLNGGSADPDERPIAPLCRLFLKRADRDGSCAGTLREWAQVETASHPGCHASLSAVVLPIATEDGPSGAVAYASGFLPAGETATQVAPVLDRAQALGFDRREAAMRLERMPRLKPAEVEAVTCLLEVIRGTIEAAIETRSGPSTARTKHDYSHIIGESTAIRRLFSMLDRVADSDSTVLIQGENGTGKELFARAVHANSHRRSEPFVTQNCSALNDNLLDSELFGHRRGAFTGAVADKRGLFEVADGGTLFLDEVSDMSPTMQVKLLRVLQESTFVPVGDTVVRRVDVRIIAASNRNLREQVQAGKFREDLFYRLNVICLDVPPLRERRSDIPLLVAHFLDEYARRQGQLARRLSDETMGLFMAYDWPGNVRELRHEIERLVVLGGPEPVIQLGLVSKRIVDAAEPDQVVKLVDESATLPDAVEALERRMIRRALLELDWNKTRAAKRLGISRRNLIRKVKRFGLQPES